MTPMDVIVIVGALGLIGALAWFFFGPREASHAVIRGGVQELTVVVKGGYQPDLIRVRQGVPVRLVFDRQETGDCTSRVVFPDFKVNASLPAYKKTAVEFTADRPGQFGFACGMNMVHGTLVVEPADGEEVDLTGHAEPAAPSSESRTATTRSTPIDDARRWIGRVRRGRGRRTPSRSRRPHPPRRHRARSSPLRCCSP